MELLIVVSIIGLVVLYQMWHPTKEEKQFYDDLKKVK